LRALRACEQGYSQALIADLLGLAPETVSRWWNAYQRGGLDAIPHDRIGRPPGLGRTLSDDQGLVLCMMIDHHPPAYWGIASSLWTRHAVHDLILQEYGIDMPIRTVGEYLQRWGYTWKKAERHANNQNPEEVEEWLEHIYPAIAEFAEKEDAEIQWGDEKGVTSNETTGYGYARAGERAKLEVASHPSRMNVVSTISNSGKLHFMTYGPTMTSSLFIEFLTRLVRGAEKKIFLIVDALPAHTSAKVEEWLHGHEDQIDMFYLPVGSPELNPDEYLNNDIHASVNAEKLPHSQGELRSNLQRFLHKVGKLPEHIMSYFENLFVKYAAMPT
jgi:transposase